MTARQLIERLQQEADPDIEVVAPEYDRGFHLRGVRGSQVIRGYRYQEDRPETGRTDSNFARHDPQFPCNGPDFRPVLLIA